MRRVLLVNFFAAALAAGFAGSGLGQTRERVVNVYNWSDYIDPTVLEDFTKTTGIKVKYDTFDSNEILETKLLTGRSGYDVVVPTGYFLERQIKAGIFLKLDKSKLPNLVHVWPEIADRLARYDPGNQYAVNYMWGTTGIGFNVARARAALGGKAKIDSWDVVFKPENIARFKDCGVMMLDSADDVLPAALHYLGLDPNSANPGELEQAAAAGDEGAALCAQIPFLGISQRARRRRNLPSARLVGRHQAGAEARGGGQERRRDRLFNPNHRHADVFRQFRDPERRAACRRGA